jgi:hypothetical protein
MADPMTWMSAQLELGQALEAKGDRPGARAAYERVLERWGKAKPRSLTAERARARQAGLDVAPTK